MNTLNMPGFTAENSLSESRTCYRMMASGNHNDSSVIIPQMSCWRMCYDVSDTNSEMAGCTRICNILKTVFHL